MSIEDDKLAFFLRHWRQLAEWSALRHNAAEVLDRELLSSIERLRDGSDLPDMDLLLGGTRVVKLRIEPRHAWIEFQWTRSRLFDGGWPKLIVVWNQKRGNLQVREAVKNSTRHLCASQGLTTSGAATGWWVWWGELSPPDEPFQIEEYASDCVQRFSQAWLTMHEPIERAVASVLGPEGRSWPPQP